MKYLDEFRHPKFADRLFGRIQDTITRPRILMEVCGGQTHSLLRHGIDDRLRGCVELIHGPGCPVCVTSAESIDLAIELCLTPNITLVSFGDMLRVPGTSKSLLDARREGGSVRIVYSPLDAVRVAQENPDRDIVFFAVGFETTAPTTALAILQAESLGLTNFYIVVSHVRVLPAMRLLMSAPDCRVQGFLAAGHVCTITGFDEYQDFVDEFKVPVVVTGFEPIDLLEGILDCVQQLETDRFSVTNRYERSVRREGNQSALAILKQVYEIVDCEWRGLGIVPSGGYGLREEYSRFDARQRWNSKLRKINSRPNAGEICGCPTDDCEQSTAHAKRDCSERVSYTSAPIRPFGVQINQPLVAKEKSCRSGDVLSGRIRPTECWAFGSTCTPESPLGAPMVSSEGACAAYFRYQSQNQSKVTS